MESGYSPSELLNGRQLRCKIDTLLPSPAHVAQGRQATATAKSQQAEKSTKVTKVHAAINYQVETPCYALYCGPRRDKDPRWVPAMVVKVLGTRCVNVRVVPRGPTWRRHIEQLRPRYGIKEDDDPGEVSTDISMRKPFQPPTANGQSATDSAVFKQRRKCPRKSPTDGYTRQNPRRSERLKKKLTAV